MDDWQKSSVELAGEVFRRYINTKLIEEMKSSPISALANAFSKRTTAQWTVAKAQFILALYNIATAGGFYLVWYE